ncbi:sensor histidine kinase (plasmid) [Fulvitalea axinellae]|uniref:histidine kinase n=1 Tax=Fulvitalea axinellae TaxID=1182444 RepID=A0AAU9CQW9_9BACT|nr:sensor histidine kinase [Fulvitalea axinellae]
MFSRQLYIQIIVRVALLSGTIFGMAWHIVRSPDVSLAIIYGLIALLTGVMLVRFMNTTNRKLAYFFQAVQNEDSTLRFSEKLGGKSVKDLNRELNRVNRMISDARKETREQERYFSTVVEHASTGIVTFDGQGFVHLANSAARQLTGTDPLTHIRQLSRRDPKLFECFTTLSPGENALIRLRDGDNTRQLALRSSEFRSPGKNLRLIAIQDIKGELDERELDAWIKLIRVLTHEIMNSIAPIVSLSETLAELNKEKACPETAHTTAQGLEVIRERGNNLIEFVDSYRKITRLPKPKSVEFGAQELLEKIRILVSGEPNTENVSFQLVSRPENLRLFADETQVAQALINIVRNALQALEQVKDAKIEISAFSDSERRPCIKVRNNGPEIPADILEEIFVPFFSTKENGSGVGLSLSRQIMRLHGGQLFANSNSENGTAFTLRFPAKRNHTDTESFSSKEIPAEAGTSK